jgi:hypothetical protein
MLMRRALSLSIYFAALFTLSAIIAVRRSALMGCDKLSIQGIVDRSTPDYIFARRLLEHRPCRSVKHRRIRNTLNTTRSRG